ncbi:unnamed protein product [Arabidopsis lyrata]|uniref:Predicted protein n=1 Tax=Arabidopsis lyrata subsp. lyrata TaxID=81972 RepID=D7LZL4_ARALL|nr:putative cysteine-rich receptor-like protein kinase 33 [Arabidopsis lyrata subsp. lyrata]EFH48855.1 predicted protein [Arabidopsis lyrata subsp. lyrata]CAH8272979.1 unnamed protein product [Arabidopsis lyrata]|eukprot:XP_002872596.1 putative cysteine-rich receptor-like protein kinase 33 [Arabidopsis lyrata subsp. lyrata]
MRKAKKISLSIFLFVLICIKAVAFSPLCIDDNGFEPPSILYKTYSRDILSNLFSNVTAPRFFYNASIGQDENTVYAMGMCITKSEPTVCSDCIKAATDELKSCPNQAEAYKWRSAHNALCFARYSNRSFSRTSALGIEMHPLYKEWNSNEIKTDLTLESFEETKWNSFIRNLVTKASNESDALLSNRKYYATGELFLTNFQSVYALMQCIPVLSSELCGSCLEASVLEYRTSGCRGTQSGIIARPRCFFRWDMQPFSGAFDPDRKDLKHIQPSKKISTTIFIAAVGLTALLSFVLSAVVLVLIFRRRKSNPPPDSPKGIPTTYSLQYDLKTIQAATCTFSKSNMLGQGGFGEVFKGLLQDGSEIAVKRLSKESAQGVQEFKNETSLVAKLQHRNLVGVLGFCMEGEEKILVYEFVPNKSLDQFLFEPTKQGQLDWAKRNKIIVGTARGILYLHHDSPLKIIHRDLKASNILLDADMEPKVADFGMARILRVDQSRADTKRVVGTYGYISPEYLMHGQFSMKSDVYSFGVLVLEIISGKRNSNFHETDDSGKNLVTHAWKHWRNGSPLELVDSELGKNYQSNEVIRCIHIALLCVQNDPEQRPNSLNVILMLTSNSITLPVPQSPIYEGMEMFLPLIKSVPGSINDSLIDDIVPR